jgi:predicted ArsR family transcriptional regulator
MGTVANDRTVHRALADASRSRLLELLEDATRAADVAELSARLGLHPNTVRSHLDVLERAGLVERRLGEPNGRGRPPFRFAAVSPEVEEQRAAEHELLAAALAGALDGIADGPALAEAAGRGWGRYLVERLPPSEQPTYEASVGRAVGLLASRGFVPEVEGACIRMHRCPFRELAERHPELVCALHRGLLNGALEEVDAPVRVRELEPFVDGGACEARLEPMPG